MSKILRIVIKNIEPIRIADDETSQHGQTDTLRYIPGSTIRGIVLNQLLKNEAYCAYKKTLLSEQVSFLNGYLKNKEKEYIPSLKGFYEDKKETEGVKELNNVLIKDVEPGFKRASLGQYCYVEEKKRIRYTDMKVEEDLSINIGREAEKRNVFRSQHMVKNQEFVSYVLFREEVEEKLIDAVKQVFSQPVYIGNRRSAGYGKCICEAKLVDQTPYAEYKTAEDATDVYLILLSHTTMRDELGEPCGLNLSQLAKELECEKLEIERCATSTVEIHGYNRIWKGSIPSATMYAAGSVFHIKADRPISGNAFRRVEEKGIGIRKNEGFGQIAFYKDFANICEKQAETKDILVEKASISDSDKKIIDSDMKLMAKGVLNHKISMAMNKYIIEHPLKNIGASRSQLGTFESLCMQYMYAPDKAEKELKIFLEHLKEKQDNVKKERSNKKKFFKYIETMLNISIFELLSLDFEDDSIAGYKINDLYSEEELVKKKLQLIVHQLRYENREERNRE